MSTEVKEYILNENHITKLGKAKHYCGSVFLINLWIFICAILFGGNEHPVIYALPVFNALMLGIIYQSLRTTISARKLIKEAYEHAHV